MRSSLVLVAALFAACTGDIATDGSGSGSGSNPPPPTDIEVQVRDGATPQAGVRVIFQDGSGNVVADTATDANGSARATVVTATVSVVRTYAPSPQGNRPTEVYSYVDAKAGDVIVLGNATALGAMPTAMLVSVSSGAQGTVRVTTPCGSGEGTAPNVPIAVTACPAMMDFFVTDGNNSSFHAQAPYAASVDLSAQVLQGDLTSTLAATDVPPGSAVTAEEDLMVGTYALYTSNPQRIDGQTANVNLPNVQGLDRLVVASVDTTGMGQQRFATRGAYSPTPVTVDVTPNLAPYVSAQAWSATSGVTWTETGAGTADAVIAMLDVTPKATLNTSYWRVIVAPHAGTTLAIPSLPDASLNPVMDDQVATEVGIVKVSSGYRALIANAFAIDDITVTAPSGGAATVAFTGGTPPARITFP